MTYRGVVVKAPMFRQSEWQRNTYAAAKQRRVFLDLGWGSGDGSAITAAGFVVLI